MTKILEKPDRIINEINYYNTDTVSRVLSLHPITVRRYFRLGVLPRVKIGQHWTVSESDLEIFIINGKLKKREQLNYRDYKSLEKEYIEKIEGNLKKIEKELEYFKHTKPAIIRENLTRRYNEIKEILAECKKDPMTKKDFNTFVE